MCSMLKKTRISLSYLCCIVLFAACSSESSVYFQSNSDLALGAKVNVLKKVESPAVSAFQMTGLNSNGKRGTIAQPEKSPYSYLSISQEQIPHLALAKSQWGGVSCWITVEGLFQEKSKGTPSQESPAQGQISLGFLYQDDFTSSGKLQKTLRERPLATCLTPLQEGQISGGEKITLSMVIPSESIRDFRGVVLHSTVPVSIVSAGLQPIQIGFSGNYGCAFSSQGGSWDRGRAITGLDFSSAKKDFDSAASNYGAYVSPLISLTMTESPAMPEKTGDQAFVLLDMGGESIRVRRAPNQQKTSFYGIGLENPFGVFSISEGSEMVQDVYMTLEDVSIRKDGYVVEPLSTDPGMIALWDKDDWRTEDYELFEWEQFPGILFFDTADYGVQDDFFKRLAFYTEKTGYIGTLVSDRVLAGQHGFNAHDYRSETLAAFYSLAESTNFPLNEKEILLKDILLHNGIIKKAAAGGYEGGYGAVISLSQESAMYLRYTFVAHEGFHGIFFVDEDFRNKVASVYQNADPQSIRFLHRYFSLQATLNYNLEDTYLMHNEFMAYVMQQGVNRTGSYFSDNLAQRGSMLRAEPELCAYIQATKGQGFADAAQQISDYVFHRWGLEAGRVNLVSR